MIQPRHCWAEGERRCWLTLSRSGRCLGRSSFGCVLVFIVRLGLGVGFAGRRVHRLRPREQRPLVELFAVLLAQKLGAVPHDDLHRRVLLAIVFVAVLRLAFGRGLGLGGLLGRGAGFRLLRRGRRPRSLLGRRRRLRRTGSLFAGRGAPRRVLPAAARVGRVTAAARGAILRVGGRRGALRGPLFRAAWPLRRGQLGTLLRVPLVELGVPAEEVHEDLLALHIDHLAVQPRARHVLALHVVALLQRHAPPRRLLAALVLLNAERAEPVAGRDAGHLGLQAAHVEGRVARVAEQHVRGVGGALAHVARDLVLLVARHAARSSRREALQVKLSFVASSVLGCSALVVSQSGNGGDPRRSFRSACCLLLVVLRLGLATYVRHLLPALAPKSRGEQGEAKVPALANALWQGARRRTFTPPSCPKTTL
eukprot:COSAG04_NODE_1871_length_5346_cov_4.349914_2_plen_424_part_00